MEPFLEWLYAQDLSDLQALPDTVELEGMFDRAERLREKQERLGVAHVAMGEVDKMILDLDSLC